MAFSANLGGWIVDTLVSRGFSVTSVRKDYGYCKCLCEIVIAVIIVNLIVISITSEEYPLWQCTMIDDFLPLFSFVADIARGVGDLHAAGVVWGRYCSWTIPCSLRTTLLHRHGSQCKSHH
ncbi:hypothetical protein POM88_018568 [Heracleum sosnowskyi]|uniref:Uncharacterized protein n=1 Tax=Heracleum sosnowskyi TaxID=360622 RepID=A0AAD8MUU7_9APIA|nr:hypothetical protein POM88_018568 [Heracleum sosnowskyi]